MSAEYDVFLSHTWADGDLPRAREIADALAREGLKVWIDEKELKDFESITRGVQENLARSKTLLAFYSKTYPTRRACQWELTAAFLAAQQEGDPRRRVLVVNPEAGAGHIHPIKLRDAKFATAPASGDRAALQALAETVRQHVAKLDGQFAAIDPLKVPDWHGAKPTRYPRFVGRFPEMWQIHSALHESEVTLITGATGQNVAQVTGLGGIGKTLLAGEYALRFGAIYPGGVFWLRAYGNDDAKAALGSEGREAERQDQVRKFAQDHGVDVQEKKPEDVESGLRREIERRGLPCLWVVDDLPSGLSAEDFRRWCGPHSLARTLITTRSRTYDNLGSAKLLNLDVLAEDDAYQLLASHRESTAGTEEEEARAIVRMLGCHALAVEVTGARLAQTMGLLSFAEFREELNRPDKDALELADELTHELPTGHQKSIARTLLQSIERLGPEGRDFLRLASVLAVAPISPNLVRQVFQRADGIPENIARDVAARALVQTDDLSLCERKVGAEGLSSVHTLVSRAVRFRDREPERTKALRAAVVEALLAELAKAAADIRQHHGIEFQIAHARELVVAPATVPEANLLGWVARYDFERAAYVSAQALYSRELEFLCRVLGREHPNTLTSMNNLAGTLRAQGDLPGARQLLEETIEIRRRVLGLEHPATLISISNLANTLKEQGYPQGARKLQEETVAVQRRVLGPEHRDTLTSMSSLASMLSEQEDLVGARELEEETLAVRRRVLGIEHPDTLNSMNNLSGTLLAQGDLAGARQLQEEALAVQRRVLGSEHPDTLMSMNNLASTLSAKGDPAGARQLQEEELAVCRRVLGPEHPDTSISAWNLFLTLHKLGERYSAGHP